MVTVRSACERNSYQMVVWDEGEKNKWIGRTETDHHGKLSDAYSGHLPHWPLYSQKNGTTKYGGGAGEK